MILMDEIKPYLLAMLLLTMLVLCSACKKSSLPKPPTPHVQTLIVSATHVPVIKEYIGITQSIASVDIKARVKGFLIKKNFTEGKPVKQQQLLYVIDPRPFEAKVALARGQLAEAQANQQYQQVQYERLKKLVAQGDVSKSNFDQVSAQFAQAKAQVAIAQAQLDDAKINLTYCYMYAPVAGLISHKYVDVGNLVGGAEDTLLANVVQLNPMYVQFSPSVSDYAEFSQYQTAQPFAVKVTLPADNTAVFKGQLDLVNNQAETATSTIFMRATIDNSKTQLLPGVYVNIAVLLTQKKPAMLIPAPAIMETQGRRSVYLLDKNNQVKSQEIQTQGQINSQYIVTDGLKVGDKIITSNLQKIRAGETVIPLKSAPNPQ